MILESPDPHDSDVLRGKSNVLKNCKKCVICCPRRHQLLSSDLLLPNRETSYKKMTSNC